MELTLIGTIPYDLKGSERLMSILNDIGPDHIVLSYSEKSAREATSTRELVDELPNECVRGIKNGSPINHETAIEFLKNLGFEYFACLDHCNSGEAYLHLAYPNLKERPAKDFRQLLLDSPEGLMRKVDLCYRQQLIEVSQEDILRARQIDNI